MQDESMPVTCATMSGFGSYGGSGERQVVFCGYEVEMSVEVQVWFSGD